MPISVEEECAYFEESQSSNRSKSAAASNESEEEEEDEDEFSSLGKTTSNFQKSSLTTSLLRPS